MSKVTDHYKMTKYIEQACGDCIIRVEAWRPHEGDDGFADVQIISNATASYHMHFKSRIKNAWKVLRGSYDWSGFEVLTKDEGLALVAALQEATKEAFPTIISDTIVKSDVKN